VRQPKCFCNTITSLHTLEAQVSALTCVQLHCVSSNTTGRLLAYTEHWSQLHHSRGHHAITSQVLKSNKVSQKRTWIAGWFVCLTDTHYKINEFLFLGALEKLRKTSITFVMSVCLSVRPHGTARIPLYGFSLNLMFEFFFSKIYRGNKNFFKFWQKVRYIYIYIYTLTPRRILLGVRKVWG
jgi:hypothetical protein